MQVGRGSVVAAVVLQVLGGLLLAGLAAVMAIVQNATFWGQGPTPQDAASAEELSGMVPYLLFAAGVSAVGTGWVFSWLQSMPTATREAMRTGVGGLVMFWFGAFAVAVIVARTPGLFLVVSAVGGLVVAPVLAGTVVGLTSGLDRRPREAPPGADPR